MDPQFTTTNASLKLTLAIVHNDPLPDFLEIDLEAHSQAVVVGSRHRICLFTFFYLKRSGVRALPRSKFMWLGFQPPCSEPNGIRWQAQEVIGDIIWLQASWDLQAHPLKCLLSVFDQLRLMRSEREPLISTCKGSIDSSKAYWAGELEINYRSAVV